MHKLCKSQKFWHGIFHIKADSKTASTQQRRDSSTTTPPAKRMDSAEYQKEIGKKISQKGNSGHVTQSFSLAEIAAMYANKDRRGSDRLGELHTFVGTRFDSIDYSRRGE